jgi:hypothetical protein
MNKDEIALKINSDFPGVYAPTIAPTELLFKDGSKKIGYFEFTTESDELEKNNEYTFIEFGENAQRYRASREVKYITIIIGDELEDVVYPAKSPILTKRIEQLKFEYKHRDSLYWDKYKNDWKKAVSELVGMITYKWLENLEQAKEVSIEIIPVRKTDAYFGSYLIEKLAITFKKGALVILEPITALTSEYDGRLDFYTMSGLQKASILRQLLDEQGRYAWVLAITRNRTEDQPLTELSFLNLIKQWQLL